SGYCTIRSARQSSLRTDRAGSGPIGIANSLESHIEDADWVFAGHDPIADLVQGTILDHRGVADRHRSRRNLPDVTIRSAVQHEVADVALRVRVQRVDMRGWVVRDRGEGVKADAAIRVVSLTLDALN